jgi:RNA polymerase-associated protein CTR9/transcription factor SPN1
MSIFLSSYWTSNKRLTLWTLKPAIWYKLQSEKNNLTGQKSSFKIGLKPTMSKSKSQMKSTSKSKSKMKSKSKSKSQMKSKSKSKRCSK